MVVLTRNELCSVYRKYIHQHFNPDAILQYHDIQEACTQTSIRRIIRSPDDFNSHLRRRSRNAITKIVYGMKTEQECEAYGYLIDNVGLGLDLSTIPGSFLVDYLPFLKHVPGLDIHDLS